MPGNVQFYHLTATPLERALPKLLEKVFAGGHKTLVVAESDERVEQLNQLLWTYDPGSFLPHGSVKEGHSERQPVLLAVGMEKANDAGILVVTDGRMAEGAEGFERVLDMFDGGDENAVAAARGRWAEYKNLGYTVSYLRQTASGGWEQAV